MTDMDKSSLQDTEVSDIVTEQNDTDCNDILPKDHNDEISPENESKPSFIDKIAIGLFDYIETIAVSLAVVIFAFTFLFTHCRVDGPSMENTLFHGERLIISNLFYEPDYGDIIVFHQTGEGAHSYNEPIIKRVIAKEGDVVMIDFSTWTLTVNGEVVIEDYRKLEGFYTLTSDYNFPVTVPEGCLFVMGDNRNNSSDSRVSEIGFVDERRVLGRVIVRLFPFDRFGKVE